VAGLPSVIFGMLPCAAPGAIATESVSFMDHSSQEKKKLSITPASVSLLIVLAATASFFLQVFELPLTPFFWERDHLIFAYEGWRMYLGDTIYVDFFEFTMPGTQVYYALLFKLFGPYHWIINVTILGLGTVLTALALKLARMVVDGPFTYLPALAFAFFGYRWFGIDASHRMFSPVFILLALIVLSKGSSRANLLAAGALCGITSFFTQQRGFFVLCAIAVWLVADGIAERRKAVEVLKDILTAAAPAGIVLLLLCTYFIWSAGPWEFWYSTITYPSRYYVYYKYNQPTVFFMMLGEAFRFNNFSGALLFAANVFYSFVIPLTYPLFFGAFFYRISREKWKAWRKVFLVALTGFAITYTNVAPEATRLFQVSIPAFVLLAWLLTRLRLPEKVVGMGTCTIAAALLLLGLVQSVRVQTNWDPIYLDAPSGRLAAVPVNEIEAYAFVLKNTSPGDFFFEAHRPFAYFPLGLRNPTRFGQIEDTEYTRPEQIDEVIRDLRAKKPRFIIWNNNYNKEDSARTSGDHLGPLSDFIIANYSPVGKVYQVAGSNDQVWELKRASEPQR